jgi:hypothetical protein
MRASDAQIAQIAQQRNIDNGYWFRAYRASVAVPHPHDQLFVSLSSIPGEMICVAFRSASSAISP